MDTEDKDNKELSRIGSVLLLDLLTELFFWLVWTVCGIGAKFFYFLPEVWQKPTLLNVIGLMYIANVIRYQVKRKNI